MAHATARTGASVDEFLAAVPKEQRRRDGYTVLHLMTRATGQQAEMWGPSIVGFGRYTYRYASGRSGEWPATGFSPRAAATTVYLMHGLEGREDLLARLGPHTTGKSCLYLKDLDAVDLGVLEELVRRSFAAVAGEVAAPGTPA